MEAAHSQDDVTHQNFSAALVNRQRLQIAPELEKQRVVQMGYLEPARPGAGLGGRRPALSGTGSGSRGGGSVLFALYWAEVRPSVKQVRL